MIDTYTIICPKCNHKGFLHHQESDSPFTTWERFRLFELNGNDFNTDQYVSWETAIENIKPSCPECQHPFTMSDLSCLNEI